MKSIYNQSPAERQNLPHNQKRKWKYTEEDTSGGECYDCGLWYGCDAWADVVVKDEVWELINPSEHKGGGLLCFNCMNRRLTFLGLDDVPIIIGSGPFVITEEANGDEKMKPKIVCLCGSSRFVDIMAVLGWLIEKHEGKIAMGLHLLPRWYPDVPPHHLAETEGVADQMDELHLRKIDLADEIYVIDWEGYIGESTAKEIAYAGETGKQVRYLSKDPTRLKFVNDALPSEEP